MNMIRLTYLVAAAALAGMIGSCSADAAPAVGKPAPGFSATDTSGKTWSLDDLKGRAVILEWTNHECPYVAKHYGSGNMQRLQREAVAAGYVWLSVISSAPGKEGQVGAARADELSASRHATPTAVLLDPEGIVARAYGARTTPHMFVIDEQGVLVYMGGIDNRPTANPADLEGADNYVREALADRAAGRPVGKAVTRPYGCSVKY